MDDADAPHVLASFPETEAPDASSPWTVLEVVTGQLDTLSATDGAVEPTAALAMVVVHSPIPRPSDAYKFPHRPGGGRAGTRCLVKANHFLA